MYKDPGLLFAAEYTHFCADFNGWPRAPAMQSLQASQKMAASGSLSAKMGICKTIESRNYETHETHENRNKKDGFQEDRSLIGWLHGNAVARVRIVARSRHFQHRFYATIGFISHGVYKGPNPYTHALLNPRRG
jgi:hypothetical protein